MSLLRPGVIKQHKPNQTYVPQQFPWNVCRAYLQYTFKSILI